MAKRANARRLGCRGLPALLLVPGVCQAQMLLSFREAASRVPAEAITAGIFLIGAVLLLWWLREHRLARQRTVTRRLYNLGEQMSAGHSDSEYLELLEDVVPEALRVTAVHFYLYDRGCNVLRRVEHSGAPNGDLIPAEDPFGVVGTVAAACFKNRSLLVIPDTRRSPFTKGDVRGARPCSAMFVPMFAQADLMGVLAVENATAVRHFSQDEKAVAQHLANQVAIGVKLRERQSMREQLLSNEKLAATGQLISNVAAELQAPLDTIIVSSTKLLEANGGKAGAAELRTVAAEARRASSIVSRMLSFAKAGSGETATVDLTLLLRNLVGMRARVWAARHVELRNLLPAGSILVEAPAYHLEQVFLSLLAHAENGVEEAAEKRISIRASQLAGNAVVDIGYTSAAAGGAPAALEDGDREEGFLSLGICRGILRSHGGELLLPGDTGKTGRLEVTLPTAKSSGSLPPAGPPDRPRQPLTILLVEPDTAAQRRLLSMLGDRRHRAVPVASGEEAADLVKRFRFHAVICSIHLPGLNCFELREEVRDRVKAFVLLGEAFGPEFAESDRPGEGLLLTKPVEAEELNRVLRLLEPRLTPDAR